MSYYHLEGQQVLNSQGMVVGTISESPDGWDLFRDNRHVLTVKRGGSTIYFADGTPIAEVTSNSINLYRNGTLDKSGGYGTPTLSPGCDDLTLSVALEQLSGMNNTGSWAHDAYNHMA